MRDPRRTVSHYCLRITQLVSFRDRIRTKAAKILEMVSLVPCPRYQTHICSNTWDQPSSNLGSFVAGLAHTRHHSSMIGLLLCPLEPSPNLGLHSRGVSCLVFLMAEVPVLVLDPIQGFPCHFPGHSGSASCLDLRVFYPTVLGAAVTVAGTPDSDLPTKSFSAVIPSTKATLKA